MNKLQNRTHKISKRRIFWLKLLFYYPQGAIPGYLIKPWWCGSLVALFVGVINLSMIMVIHGALFPVSYKAEIKRDIEALAQEF